MSILGWQCPGPCGPWTILFLPANSSYQLFILDALLSREDRIMLEQYTTIQTIICLTNKSAARFRWRKYECWNFSNTWDELEEER